MVAGSKSGLVVPIQRGRNGTLECPQHSCTFETDEVASLAVHTEARHELGIAIGAPSTIDGEHVREARVQHMLSAHDGRHLLHAIDATPPHRSLASTHVASLTASTQRPSPETNGAIMLPISNALPASPTHRQSMEPTPATTLHPDEPATGHVPTTSSPRRVAVAFRATQLTAMAFKLTSSAVFGPVAATTEETTSIAPPMTPPSPRPRDVFAASAEEVSSAERSNTLLVRQENAEAAPTSSAATSSDAPGHEPKSIPAAPCTPPVDASSEHDVLTAVSSPSETQGASTHVLSAPVEASPPLSQGADLGGDDNLDGHDGDDGLDFEEKPLDFEEKPRLAGLDAVPSILDASSEHDVLTFTPPEEEAVQQQTFLELSSPPSPGADFKDDVDYLDDDVDYLDDHDEPCVTASIVQGSATDALPEAMTTSGVPTSQTLAHDMAPSSPAAKGVYCPDSPRTPIRASAPLASLAYRPETPETPSLPPTPDVAPTPSPFHNLRHSVRPTPPRRSSYHSDDDDDQDVSPLRGRGPARRSLAGLSSSESSASPPRQRPLEPFECPEATCNYEHVDFNIFQFHCFREHGLHIREESDDEEDVVLEQPPPPPMPQQRSRKSTKAPVQPRATTAVKPVPTRLPKKVKAPSPPSSPDVVLVRPVIALHKNAAGEYSCPTPTCPYKKTTSISNLKSHCKAKHAYDVKKADDVPSLPKRGRKRPFVNATLLDSDGPSSTKYIRFLEALEPGQEVYFDVT
ncbi:hypothetical protein SPRG_16714 [Saprolegnia parasitica CBS 223.65]|uniref:C2H2-type domain-containing protein n=1 Tax=Saprolegnia parasitica (strain CBS 223.65) TaxID=695850 RepID=A0A067BI84_SAPPC|nr:hypothetical protein SPRG_16714 [Saprolegnia parasitica CBS 223.65]KDO17868.1 hypothetical protein SPRG_16714 [Saprolegnia parasitica CBS 223.65]|eukprot:XP_012211419.1 hypothetical protein SPRG_16714 [Saprolegnia parasitica CBS 223.65]